MPTSPARPYDALLLLSFGGPEKPDDVLPFLENVTAGRGIPRERLAEVGEHYYAFGGRSPINDQCRALIAALERDFAANRVDVPIYWGNRNWSPYLADTIAQMTRDGIERAAVLLTSAYASYSGCRQYRENLYDAVEASGTAPRLDKLRHYFNHPGFASAMVDATVDALAALPDELRDDAALVFVTHSIPSAMNDTSGPDGAAYETQHSDVAAVIAAAIEAKTGTARSWDLVYCSRSGSPDTPWLEPDVNDHLESIAAAGAKAVVLVPIGFVSDHMEVIYDLDTEALATADKLGLACTRAATAGTRPAFVAGLRELFLERAAVETGTEPERAKVGGLPPSWDLCAANCCPNLRGPRPALCESAS